MLKKLLKMSTLMILVLLHSELPAAASLVSLIKQIKPSIVGVGTIQKTRRPPSKLLGTGFVVVDGYHVVTNFHVLPKDINTQRNEHLVIFFRKNNQVKSRIVRVLDVDRKHDLALLRMEGRKFPALQVSGSENVQEGEQIAFTGYPVGAILGLFPVTHHGIVSAISPVVIPAPSSSTLTVKMIKRLKHPYFIYQLDATAYPGNSGSPLFRANDSRVIGIINKVFIKESKESVLQKPSGITYAIPGQYITQLLKKNNIK